MSPVLLLFLRSLRCISIRDAVADTQYLFTKAQDRCVRCVYVCVCVSYASSFQLCECLSVLVCMCVYVCVCVTNASSFQLCECPSVWVCACIVLVRAHLCVCHMHCPSNFYRAQLQGKACVCIICLVHLRHHQRHLYEAAFVKIPIG
jgi:hypothetical protein